MSENKVENKTDQDLATLRHSTTHLMAQAVQNLYDDVKLGIGPAIENGFYYDFGVEKAWDPSDLKKIESEMHRLANQKQKFVRREVSVAEAKKELKDQPYKLELVDKKSNDGVVSFYDNILPDGTKVWSDLCQGPHIEGDTSIIKNFKLLRSGGAYWLGKETNPQLQRIYGTVWNSKEELNNYLQQIEEAEKRDHRKLGTELDLFSFPEEIGPGLSVFHPKGALIRTIMQNYSQQKHIEAGYSFAYTPNITKSNLFEISGHLNWYKEGMYPPMHLDEEKDAEGNITKKGFDYYLKPMNCPMHNLIYRSRLRSYRELPLRLFEFGTVYRYEKSGVVHGLTRARGFTQDDAHIYCTFEQMKNELTSLLQFVLNLLSDFGLNDYYLELSTKDPKKFVGSDEVWEKATHILSEVARESGLKLELDEEGAAFYGPKISVQVRDAIGRYWQLSTIQLDFNLPQLFNLEYQDSDGHRKTPVMIHRALFGSIERFFGILTEHYAGSFPAWLSPVQVKGIAVTEEFNDYVENFLNDLQQKGVRTEMDWTDDRFGKKILNASKEKVPYVVIVGAKDFEAGAVSLRFRDGEQKNGIPLKKAIEYIVKNVNQIG